MARLIEARISAMKLPEIGQVEHADDLVRGLRLRVGAGGRKAWIVRTRAGQKLINRTLGTYPLISLAAARDFLDPRLQRLADLPDETLLLPGHNYSQVPHATMGETKRTNVYMRVKDLPTFRQFMGVLS